MSAWATNEASKGPEDAVLVVEYVGLPNDPESSIHGTCRACNRSLRIITREGAALGKASSPSSG